MYTTPNIWAAITAVILFDYVFLCNDSIIISFVLYLFVCGFFSLFVCLFVYLFICLFVSGGYYSIANMLIQAGAKVTVANSLGVTPLHMAAKGLRVFFFSVDVQ